MHVGDFQIPEDHLAVIEHPLKAEKVVFKRAQLGEPVTCALAHCRKREKKTSHEVPSTAAEITSNVHKFQRSLRVSGTYDVNSGKRSLKTNVTKKCLYI